MLTEADVRVGGEEVARQSETSGEKGGLSLELAQDTSTNNPEDIHEYTGAITPEELQGGYNFVQNPSDADVESYAKYLHSISGNDEPYDSQKYVTEARRGLGEVKLAWDRYVSGTDRTKKAFAGTALGSAESVDVFLRKIELVVWI